MSTQKTSIKAAKYPFLNQSQEIIEREENPVSELDDPRIIDRAEERVIRAIESDFVGIETNPKIELYSYPAAKITVSILNDKVIKRNYCEGEAETAYSRIKNDLEKDSGKDSAISLETICKEYGLESIDINGHKVEMSITDYLKYAPSISGKKWKLVNRPVSNGVVTLPKEDVLVLVKEAIYQSIMNSFGFQVPEELKNVFRETAKNVRDSLDDSSFESEIEVVEDSYFPPCMQIILKKIQEGEKVVHNERFALTAFLLHLGMDEEEILDLYEVNPGFQEEMTLYHIEHIKGDNGEQYTPPSCSTMQTYDICRQPDVLCENIKHPLNYYKSKLQRYRDD